MKMSRYTVSKNSSLQKCGLKSKAEAPDLAWGYLFVTGAGSEGGSQKFITSECFLILFTTIPFYQNML